MNDALVQTYFSELRSSLGTAKFEAAFNRLKNDSEVGQSESVALASLILEGEVAASTARGTALGRIAKLHNSLVTFKLKQKAVGGRSAA